MVKVVTGFPSDLVQLKSGKTNERGLKAKGKGNKQLINQQPVVNLKSQYAKIYGKMGLGREQIEQLWQQTKSLLLSQNQAMSEIDLDNRTSLTEEEIHYLTDPKEVAHRILDFAKKISGGNPEKIDLLEKAVEKGFKEAERILGELPDISKETYQLVKEGFAQWREEMAK